MKASNKAFSLIEVLVAKSIIFILLATFIPIYTTISFERAVLKDRIAITSAVHDELQQKIWIKSTDFESVTISKNNETVHIHFTKEHSFIKACATWINKRGRKEERCLYGLEME